MKKKEAKLNQQEYEMRMINQKNARAGKHKDTPDKKVEATEVDPTHKKRGDSYDLTLSENNLFKFKLTSNITPKTPGAVAGLSPRGAMGGDKATHKAVTVKM